MITIDSMATCALRTHCTVSLCYFNGPTARFGPKKTAVYSQTFLPKCKSCHIATLVITKRAHRFHMAKVVQKYFFIGEFQRFLPFYHNKKHLNFENHVSRDLTYLFMWFNLM